ncbi:MAG TPA: hypothetical protein EYM89_09060 [Candidatus Marinimicrobia bacterium]|nr:hypothetical protein [Candidatus Neomarinimicrobiota bacterium]
MAFRIQRLITFSFIISTFFFPLRGESVWVKYGNQVFRGVGDAKAIALSEAEVASATGPLAILWNPARLHGKSPRSLVYAHQERFAGAVTFDILGVDLKERPTSRWSLVVIREAVQGIPRTTDALLYETGSLDDPTERVLSSNVTFFNQSQWAGMVGFATQRKDWKLGGNVKVLMHQLGEYSGWGMGFDFGAARSFFPNNVFGISVRDVTTSWIVWDSGMVERIAPEVRLGDAHSMVLKKLPVKINTMATVVMSLSGKTRNTDIAIGNIGTRLRGGLEIIYMDNLRVRFGRNPLSGASMGLGLGFDFGDIDYAFVPSPLGTVLGSSHYVSLNLKLDALSYLRTRLGL